MYDQLIKETEVRFSRSGGPGGQNVNKVSTQVELLFDIQNSLILTEDQKFRIVLLNKKRINYDGVLILKCSETRSQKKNREIVENKFIELIKESLKPIKKRKPTKPTISSVERRLSDKKNQSDKKKNRKPVDD